MSTTRMLSVRLSSAAYERLEAEAAAAGLTVSALARQRLEAEGGDGRARRWAALRAEARGLLRAQPDEAVALLAGEIGPAERRAVALAAVAASLRLGRALSTEEAGVVADVAAAELSVRREVEDAPDEE